MKTLPAPRGPTGSWVQTQRSAHEAWSRLIGRSPLAARVMHELVARVGDHNAVVISQSTLAGMVGATRQGVQKALKILEADRWIEVRQIGQTASTNAYVLNDRVVWSGPREGIRYALFSAAVVVSDQEQPDADSLDDLHRPPLRTLPTLYPGERQLPAGDGLLPPSQPSFPGLEPDLPARQMDIEGFTRGK